MVTVGGGDSSHREMGDSVSCGLVHLSQEDWDNRLVQRAVVVTFMLVMFFVPVGPGVLGNRHSSTHSSLGSRGGVGVACA